MSKNNIDKELLDILVCPACQSAVNLEDDHVACQSCARRYPIQDGIPIMLLDAEDA